MRLGTRIGVFGLASACALCVATAPAGAAKVKGKLSEPGYTVIALAGNGKMTSTGTQDGDFRLRTTAETVTLHLRAPDGTYAGPVVVGGGGKQVIVGVKAGASLGSVTVHEGYASTARNLQKRSVDASRTARARGGVPLGAGVFGRVRSSTPRKSPPGDPDLDGIPNPIDVDDDGDLILDNLDRQRKPRSSLRSTQEVDIECGYELTLDGGLRQTRNANVAGVTDAEIDSFLANRGGFVIGCGVQESATGNSVTGGSWELDCGEPQSRTDPTLGGLVYCTRGGTGRIPPSPPGPHPPRNTWPPFPGEPGEAFDPDGDGFGTLSAATDVLSHGAGSTQIGTGDTLIGRFTKNGVETRVPMVLQYVPATTQAIASFDDGRGTVPVQYPVPAPDSDGACPPEPGCTGWSGLGTQVNPFPVVARSNDHVVLTFTFWRPQRRPIGEGAEREACLNDTPPCQWVDIGALRHTVGIGGADHRTRCLADSYSVSDQNLEIYRDPPPDPEDEDAIAGSGGVLDKALDTAANPANTFTYTVNFTDCLRSDPTWAIGETKELSFLSSEGSGGEAFGSAAVQSVYFTRQAPPP